MHSQTLLSLLLKVPNLVLPGESWGLISLVRILVNDCHSDMSPVNNSDSDSGAFGYFLRTINLSSIDKSTQQESNKNSNDIISRDTMH